MRLKIIKKEEYVLDSKEFLFEKSRKEQLENTNNDLSFRRDMEKGALERYAGTFVAYKEGVLCGQSKNEEILRENINFVLCTPNVSLYKVEINKLIFI